ncbi:MAG: hypothetical protein V1820_00745 [archaeon]
MGDASTGDCSADPKTLRQYLEQARDTAVYTAYLWGLASSRAGLAARDRLGRVDPGLERTAIALTGALEVAGGVTLTYAPSGYSDPLEGLVRGFVITYLIVDGGSRALRAALGVEPAFGGLLPETAAMCADLIRDEIADYRERKNPNHTD